MVYDLTKKTKKKYWIDRDRDNIVTALKEPLDKFSKQYNLRVQASIQKDLCQAAHEAKKISIYAIAYCIVLISLIALVLLSTIFDTESDEQENLSLRKKIFFSFSARRSFTSIFRVNYRHRGLDCLHMLRIILTSCVIVGHRLIQHYHASVANGRFLETTITWPLMVIFYNGSILVDGYLGIGGLDL
ncbi:uncharacterized protein LOC117176489 [Belonocnema kinseyi]|uniref:uncharacterized protein LOC117176489 n=1 Tax=Belonocnema kinseyi TaxID=2817044 RepID=UPI00143D156B|nr:uncharacterized protein LOC117176489 [Belonocnema kinseyi]